MRIIISSILLCAIGIAGCGSSQPPAPAAPFVASTDMKQLMGWVLEPNADIVWGAVGTVITEEGEQEFVPQTDEQWNAVRNAAAVVAESGNLLMLEQRARDQGVWMKNARQMIDAAQRTLQAAQAKDAAALFTAAGDVYLACSACHSKYAMALPAQ